MFGRGVFSVTSLSSKFAVSSPSSKDLFTALWKSKSRKNQYSFLVGNRTFIEQLKEYKSIQKTKQNTSDMFQKKLPSHVLCLLFAAYVKQKGNLKLLDIFICSACSLLMPRVTFFRFHWGYLYLRGLVYYGSMQSKP